METTAQPLGPLKKRAVNAPSHVRLTHPDRVLYAEQQITKRALSEYYTRVAGRMLPHVAQRILTLVRCPEGQQRECFFQKHRLRGMPPEIKGIAIQEKTRTSEYMTIDDAAGLISLVQLGVLEVHSWGAHADRPDRPDQLVFDLDPGPTVEWARVVEAAVTVGGLLRRLGLKSFVKTTGGKGLHVVTPVQRRLDWEETKAFCKAVAETLCKNEPTKYLVAISKARRRGRVFIDYLRNARGATSICPYSTRASPGATVATPLSWRELSDKVFPDAYDVHSVPERLASLSEDPWAGYFDLKQSITKEMRRDLGLET